MNAVEEQPLEEQNRGEVTSDLARWGEGDPDALDRLMPLVMQDLRRIAASYLRGEKDGGQLTQPTEFVSEIWIRLVGLKSVGWANRKQFFVFVGTLIRRILVDRARRKKALKHGGEIEICPLTGSLEAATPARETDQILAIDQALHRLREIDQRAVEVFELRYFSGLTIAETAHALDLSVATVKRDWAMAKEFLTRELSLNP